jgi:hypothetical protein
MDTVALDAKAKAFIDGHFVIDASERRRLDGFETVFGMWSGTRVFHPRSPSCVTSFTTGLVGSAVTHDPQRHLTRVALTLAAIVEHINKPLMQVPVRMVTSIFCGSQEAARVGPPGKRKSALGV